MSRVEIMHGVNLNMLGSRDQNHYGSDDLSELEWRIERYGKELGLELLFFQTNFEGEFVEELHKLGSMVDGVILNPGAWTHYAWSLHEALEIASIPAVEVHISDVFSREEWRHQSVIRDLCLTTVAGKGAEGYKIALQRLKDEFNQ